MRSVALAFVLSLLITAFLTPTVRRLAVGLGAVDQPGARRVHVGQIPRMGGIAIVVGFFVPLLLLLAFNASAARIFFLGETRVVAGIVIGSLTVATLGLCDDLFQLGAKRKLAFQLLAATAAYTGGLRIEAIVLPGIGECSLGWMAYPATVLWITTIVNALNLIDGLDGLAAGVTFFACLTNFVIAVMAGNVLIALVSATLGGAVIGFLFHNFNPAKIFMGDSGSMFLGFILATAALLGEGTTKTPTLLAIVVPIVSLGLPLMDMLFTIAWRFMKRRSIFSADRAHVHHRLLDVGLTHRRAVYTLYVVSLVFTGLALGIHFARSWQVGAVLVVLTAVMVASVRLIGRVKYPYRKPPKQEADESLLSPSSAREPALARSTPSAARAKRA